MGALFLGGCGEHRLASVLHYGVKEGAGTTGAFTILEGDTLWAVSKRYNIPMQDIVVVNNLSEPYKLAVGTRLKLPAPRTYEVREDDTLYTVSRMFAVSTSELAQLNDLSEPYTVYPRQVLRLPSVVRRDTQAIIEAEGYEAAAVAPVESEVLQEPLAAEVQQEPLPEQGQELVQKETQKNKPSKANERVALPSAPKRSSSKFEKPVDGKVISSYGPKNDGLHNDGINIAAPKGTPVKAAENGVVVYSGDDLKGTGNLVLVRHDDRWMSAYAHLDKRLIKRGDIITRGQQIGTVGSTGSVDTPQLHFELRRGTKALNPQVYMGS